MKLTTVFLNVKQFVSERSRGSYTVDGSETYWVWYPKWDLLFLWSTDYYTGAILFVRTFLKEELRIFLKFDVRCTHTHIHLCGLFLKTYKGFSCSLTCDADTQTKISMGYREQASRRTKVFASRQMYHKIKKTKRKSRSRNRSRTRYSSGCALAVRLALDSEGRL